MKKLILTSIAIATLGLSQAFAIPQVVMRTYDAGAGGNYRADPNADLEYLVGNYDNGTSTDGTWIGSFCLEMREYFNNGGTYNVAISDRAVKGGIDLHEPNPAELDSDIISVGTAYLFQMFAKGTLGGTSPYSLTWAKDLQEMFWFLEDERSTEATTATNWTYFKGLLVEQFGSLADSQVNNTPGGYGVAVMNLSPSDGSIGYNQDQLVYLGVPDGGVTLSLLGLSLVGLAAFRRRFS